MNSSIYLTMGGFYYFSFVVFLLGACLGSFLNVCVYRIPLDQSIVTPRSHCPHCETLIAWYDNIPLFSYLVLLRGKCRHCSGHISWRYPAIELLTAVLFVAVWYLYGLTETPQGYTAMIMNPAIPVYWLVVFGLLMGTFIDLEHMIIPDRVSLGGIVIGLTASALIPSLHQSDTMLQSLIRSGMGILAGSGSLMLIAVLGKMAFKKDAMGMGDVKLLGAIGAFFGWQGVLFTIITSSFIGSAVGVGLILAGKKEWQGRMPFGPCLAVGAMWWMLGGDALWYAYLRWVSGGAI